MAAQEALQTILSGLRSDVPSIRGVIITSTDGLAIAYDLPDGEDPNRVAAMVSTALGLAKRISTTLGGGELTETSVSGTEAHVFLYTAGAGVLAIVAPAGGNVGLIHMEARSACRKIAEAM